MSAKSYSDIVKAAGRPPRPQAQGSQPSSPPAPDRPPLLSAFPPLISPTSGPSRTAGLRPARSMAAVLQGKKKDPPTPLSIAIDDDGNNRTHTATTTATAAEMTLPGRNIENFQISPEPPRGASSAHATALSSASVPSKGKGKAVDGPQAPNASLWFTPQGYDLIIWCKGLHWKVHRYVLVDMSEWMEKYMPPPAKNGEPVSWVLNSWDPGMLGAILEYMYLEDYQGGDYNPMKPLDTSPILKSVTAFLAATGALVHPMMDHALARIDAAAAAIGGLAPALGHARLDTFELFLRRALLAMYGEPDQWRVRALRVALGRLAARAFPLVLRSPRWAGAYQPLWGILRVRVVVDHKWLVAAGVCEPSDIILVGFEHMGVLWVRYRREGWRPADDLMFPEREAANLPDPPPSPSPPRPAAGQKKKSKAIPIVRPDGTMAPIPGMEASHDPKAGATNQLTGAVEPATTGPGRDKGKARSIEQPSPSSTSSTAIVGTSSAAEDPFMGTALGPAPRAAPDPHAPRGSAAWWASISLQPYPSLFPAPFFIRPQSGPFLGGPYFVAETSTGEPSEPARSEVGSALGYPSRARHLARPSDSAAKRPSTAPPVVKYAEDRFRKLHEGSGGPGGHLEVTQAVTPRPISHSKSQSAGQGRPGGTSLVQSDDQAAPRDHAHGRGRAVEPEDAAADDATSSSAALRGGGEDGEVERKTSGFLPLL